MELAERLYNESSQWTEPWNFGPREEDAKPVEWIVQQMAKQWGGDASWDIDSGEHPHEANYLKLDCSKAHARLKWRPRWELGEALQKITSWHRAHSEGKNLRALCLQQITEYINSIR